jgi:hypothetical protein
MWEVWCRLKEDLLSDSRFVWLVMMLFGGGRVDVFGLR